MTPTSIAAPCSSAAPEALGGIDVGWAQLHRCRGATTAYSQGPAGARLAAAQATPRESAASGSGRMAGPPRGAVVAAGAGPAASSAATATAAGPNGDQAAAVLVQDTTLETWRTPLRRAGCVVALGKFDALHRGHQALADAAAGLCADIERQASAGQQGGQQQQQQQQQEQEQAASSTSASAGRGTGGGGGAGCGEVVLLSFSGMGAVLGWPDRLPLTAPQDRGRVLAGWAEALRSAASAGNGTSTSGAAGECGSGRVVRLRTLPFSRIRGMSPEEFVALLARDLGAAGVVAGRNYRFGFKAAGDADALVRLGAAHGLRVSIVDLVSLEAAAARNGGSGGSSGQEAVQEGRTAAGASSSRGDGTSSSSGSSSNSSSAVSGGSSRAVADEARVSSSRIRALLEGGHVEAVETLLGRKYRLVCDLTAAGAAAGVGAAAVGVVGADGVLRVPAACYRNQAPAPGLYRVLVRLVDSGPPGAEIAAEPAHSTAPGLDSAATAAAGSTFSMRTSPQPVVGPVCVPVRISGEGLEVDLGPQAGPGAGGVGDSSNTPPAWPLLLLDFDACG
ncbi:hypothetical protein HYH02_015170 [Chlamydomonas schloesseri]|uniref:FAD synthase n=1 Tax=Chlamydomonas schloesseri TaxID=2026947 RepID=A0A835SPM3_9CHLO|nr:hypothetical protein HYH02_015170 [Chlamydomonas schloesseri]|eukprot:KAG2424500.1 hypothetical protein HYH02_015170 [Chlamydomonas schloesseri]